jgi:hypothetical protein
MRANMTDGELDALIRNSSWPQFVETILAGIVAELPRRATGSANALLSDVLRHLFERGATAAAALNHAQHEADEGDDATIH